MDLRNCVFEVITIVLEYNCHHFENFLRFYATIQWKQTDWDTQQTKILLNEKNKKKPLIFCRSKQAEVVSWIAPPRLNRMKIWWGFLFSTKCWFVYDFFGFGMNEKNWIADTNKKSDFDFGLSITIQSIKLDCNPDWTIQQYPVYYHSLILNR